MQLTQRGILSNMLRFKFKYLKKFRMSANLPILYGPRTPGMIGFKFIHLVEMGKSVN